MTPTDPDDHWRDAEGTPVRIRPHLVRVRSTPGGS
jgi:hypothetical protein